MPRKRSRLRNSKPMSLPGRDEAPPTTVIAGRTGRGRPSPCAASYSAVASTADGRIRRSVLKRARESGVVAGWVDSGTGAGAIRAGGPPGVKDDPGLALDRVWHQTREGADRKAPLPRYSGGRGVGVRGAR